MKVRVVSTCESLLVISAHIHSMISSSLRNLTSRLVGCTLTSTLSGAMSRLMYTKGWPPLGRKAEYVCSMAFLIADDSTDL